MDNGGLGGALRWWRRAGEEEERRRIEEVRSRADEQHRWAGRGDERGVYGPAGAEAMRALSPTLAASPPGPDLVVGTVVHSPQALADMLRDKPPAWRYAAFVSVLVQRRSAVAARLRDARTGSPSPVPDRLGTQRETAVFFAARLADLEELVDAIDDFLTAPGLHAVFGTDERFADGEGIVAVADRLMDHHERVLALCERCRSVRVPAGCRDLARDFVSLTLVCLDGFDAFIDDFTDRAEQAGDVARFATGNVTLDPVEFAMRDDDGVLRRVSDRLVEILRSG